MGAGRFIKINGAMREVQGDHSHEFVMVEHPKTKQMLSLHLAPNSPCEICDAVMKNKDAN